LVLNSKTFLLLKVFALLRKQFSYCQMCLFRFENNFFTIKRVHFASKIISLLSNVFASLRYRRKLPLLVARMAANSLNTIIYKTHNVLNSKMFHHVFSTASKILNILQILSTMISRKFLFSYEHGALILNISV
jgi:hypothetical protein